MKTRNICTGKSYTAGEGQSGSGQTGELPESIVISHIPVSGDKEVTISQIIGMSLPDNEDDKLEDSVPPSLYGKKSLKEKWLVMPSIKPKHLGKGKIGIRHIITDRSEVVE